MTEVAFHSGVDDKLGYTCRLLRKAWRQGRRVIVSGEPGELAQLDPLLWTFDPAEFVPHVRARAGVEVAAELGRTPIWLVDNGANPPPGAAEAAQVLINLGPQSCAGVERFERVIEVISTDPEDRRAGRKRWRDYERAGIAVSHHALGSDES
jgi:DNA polymerase-3 subunit chi